MRGLIKLVNEYHVNNNLKEILACVHCYLIVNNWPKDRYNSTTYDDE